MSLTRRVFVRMSALASAAMALTRRGAQAQARPSQAPAGAAGLSVSALLPLAHAVLPAELGGPGIERATTATDDVWYKPYDHATDFEKHAREYLDWEVALVEQIKRDPAIRFRAYGS